MRQPTAQVSPQAFKDTMSRHAAAVSIVTIAGRRRGRAVTITSLMALSLQPPLVAFALARNGRTSRWMRRGRRVGISILDARQLALAASYAVPGRATASFPDHGSMRWWTDAWVFDGSIAWLAAHVIEVRRVGDHALCVLEVDAVRAFPGETLIYADRAYARASAAS